MLLKDADLFARKGAMKMELLIKNVISRAPVAMKAILNAESHAVGNWQSSREGPRMQLG